MVWAVTFIGYGVKASKSQVTMNTKFLNNCSFFHSQFKIISASLISLSCFCITLTSCGTQTKSITLTSGSHGSGYQKISEQIIESAQEVGNLNLQDNYDSQGSLENLDRLLKGESDFALLQLDVASQAMKEGKVQAVMVLANEYIHIVIRNDVQEKSIANLTEKPVAMGAEGSGVYFTSNRILSAIDLDIKEVQSSLDHAFTQLRNGEVEALVYVGPLATNQKIKTELAKDNQLQLKGLRDSVANYLTLNFPESYQKATIPQGSYRIFPAEPSQDLPTISTATALVTRPDVDRKMVALLAWSIIATARQYAQFYPELSLAEDLRASLSKGLLHIHPGTMQAMELGDPRGAWLRYLQNNKPLQAASIMLISTTTIGFILRWWRKQNSAEIVKNTYKSIADLRSVMEKSPQQTLENVEQLRQQHRLMLIDNALTPEVYEQLEKMTRVLADQCRTWQKKQDRKFSQNTLQLIDDWQVMLRKEPQTGLKQINQVEQQFKEMLLANEVDIETYILIKQLILILIMCFVPQTILTDNGIKTDELIN